MKKNTEIKNNEKFEIVRFNVSGVPIKISPGKVCPLKKEKTKLSNLHFHDETEVLNVLEGTLLVELADGSTYTVEPNETVVIASRVPHLTYAYGSVFHNNLVQFKSALFENPEHQQMGYEKYILRFATANRGNVVVSKEKEIFDCVNDICKEYTEKNDGFDMYITASIYKILGFLHRKGFLSDKQSKLDIAKIHRLEPVIKYVHEHYNTEISLADMSKLLGVSEYHFCRLWKSAVGESFIDYLNFIRVSKADKLLRTTERSVLDVALDTGFSSLSYFNRVFKKFRYCSPTVYRKASRTHTAE